MTKEVIITIDQQGDITSEAVGFIGQGCMKATEFLEKLGMAKHEMKGEFYRAEQEQEQEQERLQGW